MDHAPQMLRDAELFRDAQHWTEAGRLFSSLAAGDPSPTTQAVCGVYFAERQDYHTALVHFMRGLDGAQETGDLPLQAVIFGNLAAIYRELGDRDLAQRFQRQVLAIQADAGPSELLDWSSDALLAGNTSLAEQLINQALDLAGDAADIGTQADAWGQLGLTAARQAKPRLAVRLLIRAARGHHLLGDDQGLGSDFQNLAEVFGLLDRYEWQRLSLAAAQTCFTRAGRPQSARRAQLRQRDMDRLSLYRRMDAASN